MMNKDVAAFFARADVMSKMAEIIFIYGPTEFATDDDCSLLAYRYGDPNTWVELLESKYFVTGFTYEPTDVYAGEGAKAHEEAKRPVCSCGQEIFTKMKVWRAGSRCCGDCATAKGPNEFLGQSLDQRIAAAQVEVPYGDVGPWDVRDVDDP